MRKIIRVGNLFEFAEKRLIQKLKRGDISGYSMLDIIDYAIKVRRYLDRHGQIIIPFLTEEEKKRNQKFSRHRYYLKKGR
jgi:hypothetical protein